jgi:hypothetical protein
MRQQMARLFPVVALIFAAVLLRPLPALADARVSARPSTVNAGESTTVTVACGSSATSATLSGTSFGGPSQIAMAQNNANGRGAFAATVTIPADTTPGTYDLNVTCSNGETGTDTLIVTSLGGPATGGTTSAKASRSMLLGMAILLVLAALGALLLGRRSKQPAASNGKSPTS